MISYERLKHITLTTQPYRGSVNRFPMGNRRENRKTFLVREEGGKEVYDIVYGIRWDASAIERDEFDKRQGKNCYRTKVYDSQGHETGEFEYRLYTQRFNVVGTVREDSTFEFNQEAYHQGERGYFSDMTPGWFSTDSRRGGMVYGRYGNTKVIIPIWKGMKLKRVSDGVIKPTDEYEIHLLQVDRKLSKALMAGYEDFLKTTEVMMKSINYPQFYEVVKDVSTTPHGEREKRVFELMKDAPLDAFALYCYHHDINRITYRHTSSWAPHQSGSPYEDLYLKARRKLIKSLYMNNPDVFKTVVREGTGDPYPASDWPVSIFVNGQEVEQYD